MRSRRRCSRWPTSWLTSGWDRREKASPGSKASFPDDSRIEKFCDQAAAEFLVPARELKDRWREVRNAAYPFERVARYFKVSPIVAGRRAMDLRLVNREHVLRLLQHVHEARTATGQGRGGGDFYNNQNTRVGAAFATSVIRAAMGGRLTFKEAYDLTGLRGGAFQQYARRLGMASAMTAPVPFLLDSDVFIAAKNAYYAFDICPGFWKGVLRAHAARPRSEHRPYPERVAHRPEGRRSGSMGQE